MQFSESQALAEDIVVDLCKLGAFQFGNFKLLSGRSSPYYIELGDITSYGEGLARQVLRKIGSAMGQMILKSYGEVDKIVGVAYKGIPISTAITMETGIPSCYTRKDASQHGMAGSFVQGLMKNGDKLVIAADLVTTGENKLAALESIQSEASKRRIRVDVLGFACLFDREEGGRQELENRGLKFFALIPVTWGAEVLVKRGLLDEKYAQMIRNHVEKYGEASS